MRRLLVALLTMAFGCLSLAMFAATSNAETPPSPSTDSSMETTEVTTAPTYTSWRYSNKTICVWNVMNSSLYNVSWEADSFEAGAVGYNQGTISTVYRTAAQGCPGWPRSQILRIVQYSYPDNSCTAVDGTLDVATYPSNSHYRYVWNDVEYPTAFVNQYYTLCKDTATHRQHSLGIAMGQVLGIENFSDPSTYAVMNKASWAYNIISGAWAHDRNRLYYLMNPN